MKNVPYTVIKKSDSTPSVSTTTLPTTTTTTTESITTTEPINQIILGDVNDDGMIDATDASTILTFYAYLSTGGTEKDMIKWILL